jgi:hypothetical protein
MILNSSTIEELVLRNPGVLNKLSHHNNPINQWKLGQVIPALRETGNRAKLDLLNAITEGDLEIIRQHLELDSLVVEKLDYAAFKHHTTNIFDVEDLLNGGGVVLTDFCIARDGEQLYISTWR